jgi:predicted secreted protein
MTPLRTLLAISMLSLPVLSTSASAQDGNGLNLPPDGQTVINFSATEKRTVPQDLLMASLRIEIDEGTAVNIQKKINEAMKKALDLAKKESTFKVSTGAYSVYKYDKPIVINAKTGEQKTEPVWRGSQEINIESKDATKLLDTVGKIQELGFAMNNLAYTVSPEVADKVRDELMVEALKKLVAKADIVAKTLGKTKVDLVDVNVDTGGPVMPMYKTMMAREAMAMDAAMPAPVAEAGESDLSLTVSARALIKQ